MVASSGGCTGHEDETTSAENVLPCMQEEGRKRMYAC